MNNQSQSDFRFVVDIWNRQVTDTKTNKQTVEGVPLSSLLKTAIRLNMNGQATYTVSAPSLAEEVGRAAKEMGKFAAKTYEDKGQELVNQLTKRVSERAEKDCQVVNRFWNKVKQSCEGYTHAIRGRWMS